jgi:DNA repair protein RadC
VGEAKAAQILAAVELGKRVLHAQPPERRVIRAAHDVYAMLVGEMALLEHEELRVVLLNTRHEAIGVREVYRGNVNSVVVRIGDIYRDAIREACPSMIVVHNHPSGDPSPSAEDVLLTKGLIESGKLLGVELMDHVVIARQGFASMKESKLAFQ